MAVFLFLRAFEEGSFVDVFGFFLKLLIILVAARAAAEVFAYPRLPAVLGEVSVGVLIGPSLLNVVQVEPVFYLLAEIGILLLLFEVGMDTDVAQLAKTGGESSLVALTGVIAPAALTFWASRYWLALPFLTSLFIAGAFVATSIGITVRVLADLKMERTRFARVVLGAAVLDDVIAVVILAMLIDYSRVKAIQWLPGLKGLIFILIFLAAAPVITKLFVPPIAAVAKKSKSRGSLPTAAIALILALALAAELVGAPAIIGAFAAGIALSRKFCLSFGPYSCGLGNGLSERIEASTKPIIDLFVPVFFVVVGVSINFRAVDFSDGRFWLITAALTPLAMIGKAMSGVWAKGGFKTKALTGISMIPRGEVGLVFAQAGKTSGIFDDAIYAVVVFTVALTTLAAPLLLKAVARKDRQGA
jgi:Kef-type K+ transport system membrane component KefB